MKGYLGEDIVDHNLTKEELIMEYLSRYSYVDGDHHKTWLLDQIARITLGATVVKRIAKWESGHTEERFTTGEPTKEYLEWLNAEINDVDVVGIAP